jgi:hypothetical protein
MAGAIVLMGCLSLAGAGRAQAVDPCPRCGWGPPRTAAAAVVRTIGELRRAVATAATESTILLEDGVYDLGGSTLDIPVRGLVLRGRNGPKSRALIRGPGMDRRMVAVMVSAPDVAVADLTISLVGFHGIQVRGEAGAHRVAIHHVHIVDTGQQLIKVSKAPGPQAPCREGLVACSALEYTDAAPTDYTNGVDVINGQGWVVRDNLLRRVRGPRSQGDRAGPAILFWGGSRETIVERNLLLECYRGIALGLLPDQPDAPDRADHRGGIIRRNALCNLSGRADEPIEVNNCPGALVEHNTVMVRGRVPWSISIRFPTSRARVRNNLTNGRITRRDGAKADLEGNVTDGRREWFVGPDRGDLRLAHGGLPPIDAGVLDPPAAARREGEPPLAGKAPDAGAYEFRGAP